MTVRWPSSRVLRLLERELLWFTLLVPILAIAAFLCGGVCSVWQWWAAALVVVSSGFCRHDRLEAVWAAVGFFGWMAVVWVLLGVLANPGGWDEVAYHFPAVRLLEQGWNPLRVRTPEVFKEVFGFVQGQMEIYHVLFQMKSVWIFNAVAMKFSGDFFSPMFPFTLFIFPAVSLRLCRLVNGWLCRSLVLVLVYFIIPRSFFSLDASLVLAAIGLMACFYGIVRGERPDVLALAGYTLAMLAIKLPGIGHALVFWSVFGVFVLWRRIRLGRIFMAIGIAIVGFLPLSITPFVTGVIDYGHPLYPHCSGDSRHPPVDICHDFNWKCNADYRSMGHCGAWVNAYVSPSLARMYYRWQSGRVDFDPEVVSEIARCMRFEGWRVGEVAISYRPRTFSEGKKIGWKDGVRALYCIFHYNAPSLPVPMQLIVYFFIGSAAAVANVVCFELLVRFCAMTVLPAVVAAFLFAAAVNYLLCIAFLFRHNARWSSLGELATYAVTLVVMGGVDYGVTAGLMALSCPSVWAKACSNVIGFLGNYLLRRFFVFGRIGEGTSVSTIR